MYRGLYEYDNKIVSYVPVRPLRLTTLTFSMGILRYEFSLSSVRSTRLQFRSTVSHANENNLADSYEL